MIKPSGKEDLEAGPYKKAVFGFYICVCIGMYAYVCSWAGRTVYVGEATISSDVILSI